MKNSRKSVRIDAKLFISYNVLDEEGHIVEEGLALSRDVSKKGVQMKHSDPLPVDTDITIHLAVGENIVDVKGQVRHVEKVDQSNYRIGIEFSDVDKEVVEKLAKFYPDITR